MLQATQSPHLQPPPAKTHFVRSHSSNPRDSHFKNYLMTAESDILQRTPQTIRIFSPLQNPSTGKSSRNLKAPCIAIHRPEYSTNTLLLSTEATENNEASYNKTDSRKSDQSANSSNGRGHNSIGRGRNLNLTPGVEPFDEQLDEFSEKVAVSPFALEDQEEKTFDFCSNRLRARSVLIVQTKTLTPYLSSVKASPFIKEPISNANSATVIQQNNKKNINSSKRALFNTSILGKICDYLEHGELSSFKNATKVYQTNKKYQTIFKKKLLSQFLRESNKDQQKVFWLNSLGSPTSICDNLSAWIQYSSQKCPMAEDILKDLDRTLPEHHLFTTDEGKNRLFKVLVALSNAYSEMSYVQGMNSLAGITLFYLKEEESYSLMRHLFETIGVKKIYYPNFEGLSVLNYQLESYLNHYLPEISDFLKLNSMNVSYYTCSWFITLFADNLTLLNVIKLWNFLFVKGLSFLIQFSLAIFSKYKDEIMNMDIDEVGSYLKSALLNDNQDDLFVNALKFKVTKRLMKQLETFYNTGKPDVKLNLEKDKKSHWQLNLHLFKNLKKIQEESKKAVKPFFKNMINTITIDIPDTVKQFFKKSPSQPEPPHTLSSLLNTEVSYSRGKSLITLGDLPINTKEGTLATLDPENDDDNVSFKSFEPDEEPSLSIEGQENPTTNKRKSIALRLRKSIGKTVLSKTFIEPAECDTERLTYRPSAVKPHIKRGLTSPNETLPIIRWDEVANFHSDNEASTEKTYRGQLEIIQDNQPRSSYKSIESYGPGTSDTDFTNVEEEPISVNLNTTRRLVGDYMITNNTRSLPKTDSF